MGRRTHNTAGLSGENVKVTEIVTLVLTGKSSSSGRKLILGECGTDWKAKQDNPREGLLATLPSPNLQDF